MQKILLITDLHITPKGDTIIGLDPTARLQMVIDDALTDHADATCVVLAGDLTHYGDVESYESLYAQLKQFTVPVIPMLGNHDKRDAFLSVFTDAPQTPTGHIQSITDLDDHRIITLDTLDGPPYTKGHHAGRLCADRLAWLDEALANLNGRMPLVFTHHQPFDIGIIGMDRIKLADGDALMDRLTAHHAHLFFGHMHRNFAGSHRGVPWTCFKSPCHQGPLDLVTPNSSLSIDEPPGYGILLLPPNGVIAHMQDVGAASEIFTDTYSG